MTQAALAAAVGELQATISKIERGEILEPTSIARLARALQSPAEWLETGDGEEPDWTDDQHTSAGLIREPVAQYLSQPKIEHAPLIDWGETVNLDALPEIFWLTMKDNAMAPRAGAGKRVCFSRLLQARAGDGVLVADKSGELYFRELRPATSDRWVAHATNGVFAPLDSAHDGLRIVAVLMAEEGRWS